MENLSIYNLTIYLGIAGFLLLLFSFTSGLMVMKPEAKRRWHKRTGIMGFTAAAIHSLVMLYYFLFS